jgi:hypothetical protein
MIEGCSGIRASGGNGMRLRLEQIERAIGGEGGDTEHQVAKYLDVVAEP